MADNKWNLIEIDWEKYYETYKELRSTSALNGYKIPVLLYYHVPKEYDFSISENEQIINKITEENQEKIENAWARLRKLEIDHDKGEVSDKEVKKFLINELNEFLEVFPQFKDLIIELNEE